MVTDLSHCAVEIAAKAVKVDDDCELIGVGGYYGQITVLGCKVWSAENASIPILLTQLCECVYYPQELQDKKGDVTPVGVANESFALKRR